MLMIVWASCCDKGNWGCFGAWFQRGLILLFLICVIEFLSVCLWSRKLCNWQWLLLADTERGRISSVVYTKHGNFLLELSVDEMINESVMSCVSWPPRSKSFIFFSPSLSCECQNHERGSDFVLKGVSSSNNRKQQLNKQTRPSYRHLGSAASLPVEAVIEWCSTRHKQKARCWSQQQLLTLHIAKGMINLLYRMT